ncbi:peptidase S8 [Salinadaptatus halalkaliphilus]|uniref:Peptidase S8 n=2 Tax=Salinadaptatus halalkaliphilus TaxID=2419781 RepID=A0A4S3TKA2_9EURY|nr:peptidase S8 [Salinadaptatus halalkaliphilus]
MALVPTAVIAGTDGGTTDDPNRSEGDDTFLGDDRFESNASVDVVVRLEETTLVDVESGSAAEQHLEDHANETQAPLLEYAHETAGVDVRESFWVTNAVVLEVDTDRVDLEELEAIANVESVHRNFELPAPEPPAPQAAPESSPDRTTDAIDSLDVPAVWDEYDTRGGGVRVAVLDTGVDADHPDLELYTDDPSDPTSPGGWAAFDEDGEPIEGSTPHDAGTHGTHVSGTIAGGNASGTQLGVAPDVELLHGQVLTDEGATFAQVVAGLEWALEQDADVINLSLGTTGTYPELIDPVRHAVESDVVVVGAIGNDGPETSGSPGNVYEAVSVGAVDHDGEVAPFSGGERLERTAWEDTPGDWPDAYDVPTVVAPGVDIKSTVPAGYARQPGTSMATPHVTGTIALLSAIAPDSDPEDLEAALVETAQKPDGDHERASHYGHGIVDAKAAADAVAHPESTVDPAASEADNDERADSIAVSPHLGIGATAGGIGVAIAAFAWRRAR